ncbi:pectate lyase superfamily protein-domain-containing protein [Fusarium oxysporum]|nr:pectate lyase superfamily protein-domain-containing protein [Fusarium oxysporum]
MPFSVLSVGHHHSHLHSHHKRASNSSSHDASSLDAARKLLAAGQAAMAHANRAIIANPRPNRLEVLNSTELRKTEKAPPPLDYRNGTSKTRTCTREPAQTGGWLLSLREVLVRLLRLDIKSGAMSKTLVPKASDGIVDDTDAINKAISSGGRCGGGKCTGSTIYPATVYFPPGTYKVSSSIIHHKLTRISRYLNQNNFLRSVRNFIIDVRPTPANAQVCGIHWQVAQGTSLENIHFYMTKFKDDPKTTQQGIYMENGSGGFLSDLYFVGGKFGAYMGNQQFTASGLYFEEAETAIQIHWDWGWTMQNIVVDNCKTGLTIVGGAGGPMSTGQGIGSLHLTDLRFHYVKVAVSTSVMSDNSTALLLSNSGFYNVDTIVQDTFKSQVLLRGGKGTVNVDTWGFGRVTSANGTTAFHNGANLDSPVRNDSLVTGGRKQFFTRRRPKYDDLGFSQILDAKAYGAKGDGKTDDTAVLKHLFSAAANMSAIVYVPFGVYIITDTVEIPVDPLKPRVTVRVGLPGQVGVVEIQNMMMTVKGATAGAIMMEWNVHESGQGSAGLWDTHFRVGGAAGTDLTVKDCPKLSGKVNPNCVAASLMLHLTPDSSGYFENSYDVWVQNLVTLGSIEMVSPLNGVPTLDKPNRNGFASSILAWLGGSKNITGQRNFEGYRIHTENTLDIDRFPEACQNALTALVRCDNYTDEWTIPSYHGVLPRDVDVDSVCDEGCARSMSDWRSAVDTYCGNATWHNGAAAGVLGSFVSQGINETCQTDKKTGKYCNDIIYNFTLSESIDKMPTNELCSDCYVGRLKMMQASPFSYYNRDPFYEDALKKAVKRCSLSNVPTTAKDSPFPSEPSEPEICLSGCKTYKLQENDTCMSVAYFTGLQQDDIRLLNPWVHELCGNLQSATIILGRVICTTPPGGEYDHNVNTTNSDPAYSEYADKAVPPPSGATLATNTTKGCGRWYTVQKGDDCARVLVQYHISLPLFIQANPSVSEGSCTTDLVPGRTYCVGPTKEVLTQKLKPIPPHTRFGCFAREADTTNRSVLTLADAQHVKPMSIVACQSFCLQQGWTVWGIQNGDSCFCDNQLRMDSQILDDSKCNMHCNGNTTNVCGGKDAIEVFGDQDMLRVQYASLGCYSWSKQAIRGTTGGDTIESPDEMSVDACASLCTVTKKSDFFALWEGKLCTCGKEMTPGAKTTSMEECNVACSGQLGDNCGGKGVAEIFTTKNKNVVAS